MSDKDCYVTHREYSAGMASLEKWLVSELNLRDKAVDIARNELKEQLEHLNNLRQGVVMKEAHDRDRTAINKRLDVLETFRNKSLGVIAAISGASGVLGWVIGYIVTKSFS